MNLVAIVAIIVFVLIIALAVYLAWYNSPVQKGSRGEKYISNKLSKLPEEYIVLNDLVFYTDRGTTQVDHIVISKYGVFAIETKNYRGEIYGNDGRKEWTQIIKTDVTFANKWWKTYTYVTKNHFYNPVKQALGHVFIIKEILKCYPQLPVIPVVAFVGEVDIDEVESDIQVIYGEEICSVITDYKSKFIEPEDVAKVCSIIENRNVRQFIDNKTHVKNIKRAAIKYNNAIQSGICPRCGGILTERSGKYGWFYGCSNYPKCKFTTK